MMAGMTDPGKGSDQQDETRRRFREALERKKGAGVAQAGPPAAKGIGASSSNDKRQRQFRRKSG